MPDTTRIYVSRQYQEKIDRMLDQQNQTNLKLTEFSTSVNERLKQLEKRQDAYDEREKERQKAEQKAEEERRKAEEAVRQARPVQAWNRASVIGLYIGIAASVILSIALHFL